ncbi:fumarylacetoacetate hydrolase family protein [Reyranella sp.]|jgi:2-keto-4-pentenoate hydratase|uniref:2-keto-4-pentenoate hydratase n=1 Tax=Reyranella sp. TaxID=1929291 RepID=UPI002F9584F8
MTTDLSYAVRLLLEARHSGKQMTPPFALSDRSAVYAVQDGVAAETGPVSGWKVGARTPTAEPSAAPLLADALVRSPARFDGRAMHMIGVEIEISFHIVRDIPARREPVGRNEALDIVGDAFVGMEVVDTRIADFKNVDPEWLLADNQMNHALVIGDGIEAWRTLDWPNLRVRLVVDGKVDVDQKGGLGAVDPVRPLAWMIDHAVRLRGGIRRGQAITTGSWTGLRYYPPGTSARGEFVGFGSVEASF